MRFLLIAISLLALSACECDPNNAECLARKSGEPLMISDADGIRLFKVYRDGEWIYYSAEASKVQWSETYQCGTYPMMVGKVMTIQHTYCRRNRYSYGSPLRNPTNDH